MSTTPELASRFSWPPDWEGRFINGIFLREKAASETLQSPRDLTSTNSIFGSFESQAFNGGALEPVDVDRRWISISAASSSGVLANQLEILSSLADTDDLAVVCAYALGCIFADHIPTRDDLWSVSDEDFSILLETIIRSGKVELPIDVRVRALATIKHFVRQLTTPPYQKRQWSRHLDCPFGLSDIVPKNRIEALGQLSETITLGRRWAIHIIGPDLLSAIQVLSNPQARLTSQQLVSSLDLLADWSLDVLSSCLLIMRAWKDGEPERSALSSGQSNFNAWMSSGQSENLSTFLGLTNQDAFESLDTGDSYADCLLAGFANLQLALVHRDHARVSRAVVDIYALDGGLVGFLPWNKIAAVLSQRRPATPRSAFVTMLMGTEIVRVLYPEVWFQKGTGALISDLTSLMGGNRAHDAMTSLLTPIKTLPPSAAARLTLATAERPIFERIAAGLTTIRSGPAEFLTYAAALSSNRIEFIHRALQRGLLEKDYVKEQYALERDQMRLQYFQRRMRAGRVRIPWSEIIDATKTITEGDFPLQVLKASAQADEESATVVPRIAHFIAARISDQVLHESSVSIDQALSNNLRHGIVVPRFLRALDDALQTVLHQVSLPTWDEKTLESCFNSNARLMLDLRAFINVELRTFVRQYLTIERGGVLETRFRKAITIRVMNFLQKRMSTLRHLERGIILDAGSIIRRDLRAASRLLSGRIKKAIFAELALVRRRAKWAPDPGSRGFLDSLETNLHEAFEEVREWIAIAGRTDESIAFTLTEIVKLELFSTQLSNWGKLKVSVNGQKLDQSKSVGSEAPIQGRYLDMFQDLVHNLLSNAFKYSGQHLKTDIAIDLSAIAGNLILRCSNSVSADYMKVISEGMDRTRLLARRRVGPDARKDRLSGFQKIRLAIFNALGREPIINIPPGAEKRRRFLVEVEMRGAGKIVGR